MAEGKLKSQSKFTTKMGTKTTKKESTLVFLITNKSLMHFLQKSLLIVLWPKNSVMNQQNLWLMSSTIYMIWSVHISMAKRFTFCQEKNIFPKPFLRLLINSDNWEVSIKFCKKLSKKEIWECSPLTLKASVESLPIYTNKSFWSKSKDWKICFRATSWLKIKRIRKKNPKCYSQVWGPCLNEVILS